MRVIIEDSPQQASLETPRVAQAAPAALSGGSPVQTTAEGMVVSPGSPYAGDLNNGGSPAPGLMAAVASAARFASDQVAAHGSNGGTAPEA
jgi:hypothetical protein